VGIAFKVGDLLFRPADATVVQRGRVITLPPRANQVLAVLVEAAPRVVPKQELLDTVWSSAAVGEAALTQRVRELRRLLGDHARSPRFIQTVARRGYRVIGRVVRLSEGVGPIRAGEALARLEVLVAEVSGARRSSAEAAAFHELLQRRLAVQPWCTLASVERVRRALRLLAAGADTPLDETLALTVARRDAGIHVVVSPTVRRLGASFILEVRALSVPTGEVLFGLDEEASRRSGILGALRAVTEQACASLRNVDPTAMPRGPKRPDVTTRSLEALDSFARGLEWADRFEWRKASDLFLSAVDLDPEFASAWAWLASARLWLEEPDAALAAAERAAASSNGVTEAERHFVLATKASFAGHLAETVDHLEMLLALEPDHFWGAYRLAHAYLAAGRVEDSLAMREVCARLQPGHLFNISEAAFTRLFAVGDFDGADRDYRRVVALDPSHPFAIPFLIPGFRAWLSGDVELAQRISGRVLDQRLESLLPLGKVSALVHDARLRLFCGDVPAAVQGFERALATVAPGSSLDGWVRLELALTLRDLGDDEGFRREIAVIATTGTPLNRAQALLWLGLHAARAGDLEAAANAIRGLRETHCEGWLEFGFPTARFVDRVRRVFPRVIQAELALARGNATGALAGFRKVLEELPLGMDAAMPIATTGPRDHLAAREGIARSLAVLGETAEAIAAETWLVDHRLQLFITSRAGVGCWFEALARRALLEASSGRAKLAAQDVEAVLARWGELEPPPAAVRIAREAARLLAGRSGRQRAGEGRRKA
jgi:DNA-binding winged helix-turn-helix (wHTH) protein/tetratricopeptide (TPR) repeat protein